jgi:hypothetical protein
MLESKVTWMGLGSMIADIKYRNRIRWPQSANRLTQRWLTNVHNRYKRNLSGRHPSTASHPLPVGIRSGTLLAGAQKRQINQYRGYIENLVPYSGFIEEGTYKMAPRRPLGAAVEVEERKTKYDAEAVMVEVWEK